MAHPIEIVESAVAGENAELLARRIPKKEKWGFISDGMKNHRCLAQTDDLIGVATMRAARVAFENQARIAIPEKIFARALMDGDVPILQQRSFASRRIDQSAAAHRLIGFGIGDGVKPHLKLAHRGGYAFLRSATAFAVNLLPIWFGPLSLSQ